VPFSQTALIYIIPVHWQTMFGTQMKQQIKLIVCMPIYFLGFSDTAFELTMEDTKLDE
jgi:hypothetical protein